jgi:hypothetical protein
VQGPFLRDVVVTQARREVRLRKGLCPLLSSPFSCHFQEERLNVQATILQMEMLKTRERPRRDTPPPR